MKQNKNVSSKANATVSQYSNISKTLGSIQSQLANISRSRATPVPKKPTYLHEREEGLKELYREYRDNLLADYIYGLYHPDVVFNQTLDIKSPSYMPVPTTTFKFKETFTIAPNDLGNFVLHWSPNYLGTAKVLTENYAPPEAQAGQYTSYYSNIFINREPDLDGNTPLVSGWRGVCFKHVLQDFEKYRLTSACIKVKYTGKVLDQSGMMSAAASYVKAPRTVLTVPVTETISSYDLPDLEGASLAQFCDFDNIRQGQWADTCSLVTEPDGITCVYVPTDPLNQVFVDNGQTIDASAEAQRWVGARYLSSWKPKNANISYAICGYGLSTISSCITVEAYYNYEIIVRQEQYPYFSPRVSSDSLFKHGETLNRAIAMTSANGLVTHTKTHENASVWTKVRGAFTKAANIGAEVLPYLKPLMKILV
jgi:hypothetical protein